MRIAGVAGAFPKHYYSQAVLAGACIKHWGDKLEHPESLERLHSRLAVDGRYLTLPLHAYEDLSTWGRANSVWIEAAQNLGEKAICRALTRAGWRRAILRLSLSFL